jgi:hypothetical protein
MERIIMQRSNAHSSDAGTNKLGWYLSDPWTELPQCGERTIYRQNKKISCFVMEYIYLYLRPQWFVLVTNIQSMKSSDEK